MGKREATLRKSYSRDSTPFTSSGKPEAAARDSNSRDSTPFNSLGGKPKLASLRGRPGGESGYFDDDEGSPTTGVKASTTGVKASSHRGSSTAPFAMSKEGVLHV